MEILFRPDGWNSNDVLVLFKSGEYILRSDPIGDPGNISFVVYQGSALDKVIRHSPRLAKLQDELGVLLGATCEMEQREGMDNTMSSIRVLTTSLSTILQSLSITERIQLLFHKSGAVRSLLASHVLDVFLTCEG